MRSPARPAPDLSDADAVSRARDGDHDAFRVLVERYQGRAYRLAARLLGDPDLARDAVQEGFLKAYGSLERFEGRSGFYTWLYRLVFNLCIDMKRRDRSTRHVEWDDEVARRTSRRPSAPASCPSPAAELDRGELREALAHAIEQLPEDARRTLLLREVDGLSYAEIAAGARHSEGNGDEPTAPRAQARAAAAGRGGGGRGGCATRRTRATVGGQHDGRARTR